MKALRILVVEDDAVIGMLLAEMLVGMGHDVCAIEATQAGAVTAAIRCRPDLMIVDAKLREGSGIAAVEEILRTDAVPYVFMSGARVQVLSSDAVMLRKPFRESELIQAMQRALGAATAAGPRAGLGDARAPGDGESPDHVL